MAVHAPAVPVPASVEGQSPPRRAPSQRRSRERVERLLSAAATLITDGGSEAMHMSDVADLAGVSIGSLYQYFPDKAAIIRTLAERFNAYGLACVEADLVDVRDLPSLREAMARSVDGYYAMFRDEPAMREIWSGTQADKALQAIDVADIRNHGALLQRVITRLRPEVDRARLAMSSLVLMQALAATVRLAISLDRTEGDALIASFKRILVREIEAEFFGAPDASGEREG